MKDHNIFLAEENAEEIDLVMAAQNGSRDALEALVGRHQSWIYNIAVRMVGNPHDAQDVTQEILIKMMTKLSTFKHRSSFRTWLYRIVVNQVISMKRTPWERLFHSLDRHTAFKEGLVDETSAGFQYSSPDSDMLMEETKSLCLTGMLLCLDRSQRIVFILGAILGIDGKTGGKLLKISPGNYRQKLSRSRRQISHFMNDNCGLVNEDNDCRCSAKTGACIKAGLIDPEKLRFNKDHLQRVGSFVSAHANLVDEALQMKVQNIFRNQPMLDSPDYSLIIDKVFERKDIRQLLDMTRSPHE